MICVYSRPGRAAGLCPIHELPHPKSGNIYKILILSDTIKINRFWSNNGEM